MQVHDRVLVRPEAFSRAGDSGVITLIGSGCAIVQFDDGDELAYELDELQTLTAPPLDVDFAPVGFIE